MTISLNNSIGIRLLRVVFSCYLIVTLVVTGVQLYMEYHDIEKGVLTELYNISQSFEDSIAKGIWDFDITSLESNISGISKIAIIDGVMIAGADGDPLALHADFTEAAKTSETAIPLAFPHDYARKVTLPDTIEKIEYYEYAFDIEYMTDETSTETVGRVYLYSSRDTVIQRVSDSFTLIIINALIKTFGLWVIFLITMNRMIASPLGKLTTASNALSRRDSDSATDEELLTLVNSKHNDEIQILSTSFLNMKKSINDKIENLNNLNRFAIALTQSHSQKEVLERVQYLVQQTFNFDTGKVFLSEHIDAILAEFNDSSSASSNDKDRHHYMIDSLRANHVVTYFTAQSENNQASDNRTSPEVTSEQFTRQPDSFSYLYLPLIIREKRFEELVFIGSIDSSFLDNNQQLITEYIGFLTILASIASETLEAIAQREVIRNHNKHLELRVKERTLDLEKANEQLKFLALHDALTGLPNRTLFHDRLAHLIHSAKREGKRFSVANIDLTKFKDINDTYGHDAGDTVLKEVGRRFDITLRKSDTIARMGGDEYAAIIIQESDHELIEVTIKRLIDSLTDPVAINEMTSLDVRANIGVAFYPQHSTNDKLLLKYSDIAMYEAKRNGKGYAIFDPIKNNEIENQQDILNDLDIAIHNQALELYLEPTLELATGNLYSFEAKLFWQHPTRGLITPKEYMPHAEQSDLIVDYIQLLIEKACLFFKTQIDHFPNAHISVHLPNNLLHRLELVETLNDAIKQTRLPSKYVKLEVTESSFARNSEAVLNNLNKLHRYGFLISICNFGTGLSCLTQLTKLPLHDFQIDRTLLLSKNEENNKVIATAIKIAHAFDVKIIADGLDKKEKIVSLIDKGCDYAQGPYFCETLNEGDMKEWLNKYKQ